MTVGVQHHEIETLTVNQIQKIYTKEITNWSEVGGKNVDINAFAQRTINNFKNYNSIT